MTAINAIADAKRHWAHEVHKQHLLLDTSDRTRYFRAYSAMRTAELNATFCARVYRRAIRTLEEISQLASHGVPPAWAVDRVRLLTRHEGETTMSKRTIEIYDDALRAADDTLRAAVKKLLDIRDSNAADAPDGDIAIAQIRDARNVLYRMVINKF